MALEPVEYGSSRKRMAFLGLMAIAFSVGAGFVAADEGASWLQRILCGLAVPTFGFCAVFSLMESVRPRLKVRFDATGLRATSPFGGDLFHIPWPDLGGARIVQLHRQPMVVLDPIDPEWGMRDVKPSTRMSRTTNRALVGSWMSLAPRNYGLKPEAMLSEIERFGIAYGDWERPDYERPLGSRPGAK